MLFFNFLFAFACIINIFPFCFTVIGGPRKGERRAYKSYLSSKIVMNI